jgi:hypothetical protein
MNPQFASGLQNSDYLSMANTNYMMAMANYQVEMMPPNRFFIPPPIMADEPKEFKFEAYSVSTRSNSDETEVGHLISPADITEKCGQLRECARVEQGGPEEGEGHQANSYKKKYKTEICKNFELGGSCRWGETCCFAHGQDELKNKTHLNSNYKSKICKHFHRSGVCPYGTR